MNPSSRPAPAQRIGPARLGQPASSRNFSLSSAGGAGGRNHLDSTGAAGQGNGSEAPIFGAAGKVAEGEKERERRCRKEQAWGESYIPEEDSIRNDYSSRYVATGERPQNHLRNAAVEDRFKEYPKLASLLHQKHLLTSSPQHSIPPTYLTTPSIPAIIPELSPTRYDVILLTPPPEVGYEELLGLDLGSVASTPGFIWLWVGSGGKDGVGLERGRELLANWGYRRCEDIVWLKTNKLTPSSDFPPTSDENDDESKTLFSPTIEHCLMGIRGTVRRSNDPWFVHCNVDTDVLVWERPITDLDTLLKPPEMQSLIENFCLGTRRLHLYGSPHSLRRGWLTVGKSFERIGGVGVWVREVEAESGAWEPRRFAKEEYARRWRRVGREEERFRDPPPPPSSEGNVDGSAQSSTPEPIVESLLPFVAQLDALRPKSPPARNGLPSSGGLGRGRGAGLGITRTPQFSNGNGMSNGNGKGMGRGREGYGGGQQFQQSYQQQYQYQQASRQPPSQQDSFRFLPPPASTYHTPQQPYSTAYNPYVFPPPSNQPPYYPPAEPNFYPQSQFPLYAPPTTAPYQATHYYPVDPRYHTQQSQPYPPPLQQQQQQFYQQPWYPPPVDPGAQQYEAEFWREQERNAAYLQYHQAGLNGVGWAGAGEGGAVGEVDAVEEIRRGVAELG